MPSQVIRAAIPDVFEPLINPQINKIIEPSGRSSGKSTTNETVMIMKMLQSRANNMWYCRAERSDIRSSIFSSMWGTAEDMGVARFFKRSINPFEMTCTLTGAKCYFSGINGKTNDDLTATKGFYPQGKTLCMFVLDEANEVKSPQHVRAAETTAEKYLIKNSKIVYAYNPPPVRTHWAHQYFNTEIEKGATKIYSTYKDIWDLLKDGLKRQILEMRDSDYRQYEYWYLGKMVSLQGLVLYTFNEERNTVSVDDFVSGCQFGGNLPLYIIFGVDSGIVSDATAVSAWAVMADATLLKLSTFYLEPKKIGRPVPNSEQCDYIYSWYKDFKSDMRRLGVIMPREQDECWVFDNAVVTQDLMIEWGNRTGFMCKAVEKKNIERDIKRLQNGYFRGLFKILKTEQNEPSFREIDMFCYDENNEIPDGQADHTIDADKYATAHYYYGYMSGIAG